MSSLEPFIRYCNIADGMERFKFAVTHPFLFSNEFLRGTAHQFYPDARRGALQLSRLEELDGFRKSFITTDTRWELGRSSDSSSA